MTADLVLIAVLLADLKLLASSRLGACIRTTGVLGFLLGFLPLLVQAETAPVRAIGLAAGSMVVKGVVFPWLLFRAVREAEVTREVEPYVGYVASILVGVLALGMSFWLDRHLPLATSAISPLLVPVAVCSMLVGLFLIVGRKGAVNQVLGFLVLENGIYTFGVGLVAGTPFLVELGVLLDAFVAVFVMGIAVYHINREFDHIEADRLDRLKG